MTDSTEGISPGDQECINNQITRGFPLVSSPTGTWVYAIDKLFAEPTNGSAGWHLDASGDLYYNGTYHPVFDWYDRGSGQVGTGAMDAWDIASGWTVETVQYVWDDGVWYYSVGGACAF